MAAQFWFGVCLVATAATLCCAVCFYCSYAKDTRLLRVLATQLTETTRRHDDKVNLLSEYVFRNSGFAKNTRYFLIAALGPTPMQVLEEGGDCSDKSRLLAAMLEQIGIKSSLAMLYRGPGCLPVHTVVLAETESGVMAADPAYNMTFPRSEGGYYDVQEMARDSRVLTERLAAVRAARGVSDKITLYDESTHHYQFVMTVNWAKYPWLAAVSSVLKAIGKKPNVMRRPALLEDPKLLLLTLSGLFTVFFAALAVVLRAAA